MGEALEGAVNIAQQGDIARAGGVVPVEVEATVLAAIAVNFAFVVLAEGCKEVVNIALLTYLMPKPLTTREKMMGRVLWCHNPVVRGMGS